MKKNDELIDYILEHFQARLNVLNEIADDKDVFEEKEQNGKSSKDKE